MAVVADTFEAQWRSSLVTALERVTGNETVGSDQAIARLAALRTSDLLALDKALRRGWRSYYSEYSTSGRVPVLTPISDPIEGAAYLFAAACHGNGFIRERAMVTFEHYPGRLALVAALIRCDDWVPPVQQAAVGLLQRLVGTDAAAFMFDLLPLLLRLQQRRRVAGQVWVSHIEPVLLSPRLRDLRWGATKSSDATARAFAHRLVLSADPDRAEEALRCACADWHPAVALWGLGNVRAAVDPPRVEEIVRAAMRHGNSSVRAAALRRYAGIGPGDLRDVLEESIYDSSREARDAAAHLLGSLFEESARERWRRVIDSGAPERIRVAVTALSYVSETEDIARLEPFLDDPVASIRAAALRGLVHAKARGCDEYYLWALCDPSGLVVRHALRMMAKEGQLLGLAEIQQSHARASSERVRRQLIRAARLMGKWDALIFLLSLLATVDASVALEEIHRWLELSNRRFTALDSETRGTITKRLAELGQSTDARLAPQIEEVMKHS